MSPACAQAPSSHLPAAALDSRAFSSCHPAAATHLDISRGFSSPFPAGASNPRGTGASPGASSPSLASELAGRLHGPSSPAPAGASGSWGAAASLGLSTRRLCPSRGGEAAVFPAGSASHIRAVSRSPWRAEVPLGSPISSLPPVLGQLGRSPFGFSTHSPSVPGDSCTVGALPGPA